MARRAKGRTASPEPVRQSTAASAVWERPWFPAAVLAVVAAVYFSDVFAGKVVFGIDVGTDYHKGEALGVVEKLVQPKWGAQLGGYPDYEGLRWQYFPASLIYLFTTFHRHLAWRYLLVMFLAGFAMYLYLRNLRLERWPSLWGGLAFMSAPTFLAFTYAGHYAKMTVIALFPLMCLLVDRMMSQGRPAYAAGLAAAIAMGIYSPHIQMLYYALWGMGLYFLYRQFETWREQRRPRAALVRMGLFAAAVALGLSLGAEGLFPSYVYTRTESKRAAGDQGAGRTAEQQLEFARSWSLHPEEVASLIVPEFGGYSDPKNGEDHYWGRNAMKLNSEYFGVLVLLLALLKLPDMRRAGLPMLMGGLFLLALLYSLGSHTPVHYLFYLLAPGAKVLRTPGMIAFLFAFAACVLAAHGLAQALSAPREEGDRLARRVVYVGGAVAALALLVAVSPRGVTDAWISLLYSGITPQKRVVLGAGYGWLARGGLYVALVAAAGTALLYLRVRRRLSTGVLLVGLAALALFDTWRIDRLFLRYEDPGQYGDIRRENPRTVEFLRREGGQARVFPIPDYRFLDQPGLHLYGIPVVTGFHDFTLRRYDRILRELDPAISVFEARYYEGQAVRYTDEQVLESIRPLLNLLAARYLVAPQALRLQAQGFPEAFAAEGIRVCENPQAMPWAYLVPSCQVVPNEVEQISLLAQGQTDLSRTALVEEDLPIELVGAAPEETATDKVTVVECDRAGGVMRLETQAKGPRLLVVSENYHPNWRARVDGKETNLHRANYLWQAVPVPTGEHEVELVYHSSVVNRSRWVGLVGLLLVLGLGALEWWVGRPAALRAR